MSLWLQASLEALHGGRYERLRRELLPICPIPVPSCLSRELEFAEVHCREVTKERLFPIRFLWLLEANEQRLFGLRAAGRSQYHPEKLLDLWQRASTDLQYREDREAEGFRFDFDAKAVEMLAGWIYIGDHFIDDFLEIEAAAGVELLFPGSLPGELSPAFRETKSRRSEVKDSISKSTADSTQPSSTEGSPPKTATPRWTTQVSPDADSIVEGMKRAVLRRQRDGTLECDPIDLPRPKKVAPAGPKVVAPEVVPPESVEAHAAAGGVSVMSEEQRVQEYQAMYRELKLTPVQTADAEEFRVEAEHELILRHGAEYLATIHGRLVREMKMIAFELPGVPKR